ncbi:MAG: alanine--tRNA ligase, partial [Candidatus Babeliales bacterium]
TTCQKCVRAGGKHNDLDQVGFTARHLTFFEMLGNFSFGDYFKKEAIQNAWDLLTKELHLPAEKLYITVYKTDDEAYNLWHAMIGVPADHISRLGEKDNFWQMGDTGPCGPCTEIYVDRGAHRGCGSSECAPGCDCSRYTEIWNLVFMQYNRQADGTLLPLTQTGVDTGMGLERLCMIMQDKDTVFHIDAFAGLIKHIEEISKMSYEKSDDNLKAAFHVVAEHVRAASLLIADGCSPSNDGRGYVLRKIIRRAALFAQKLSSDNRLFSQLAVVFIDLMKEVYPELETNKNLIIGVLDSEVDRFAVNLVQGQNILQRYIAEQVAHGATVLPGQQAFKLYDTYGFPCELTELLAKEKGFSVDKEGFESCMQRQQEQSGKKCSDQNSDIEIPSTLSTKYVGDTSFDVTTTILFVQNAPDGGSWIVTEQTPFYVECGGQVGDKGTVIINQETFNVVELRKVGDVHAPAIAVKIIPAGPHATPVTVNVGMSVRCVVDKEARLSTARNHTATHLLQAALMQTLGKQVKQAGSLVNEACLRFDFTHNEALSKEQIKQVEVIINQQIMDNVAATIYETTLDDAKAKGVISFFGEKYNPERVRVVDIPAVSAELCGGSHISCTGQIGSFKIISEVSLATGTRRITAVTGCQALATFQASFAAVKKLSEDFKVKNEDVIPVVTKLQQQCGALQDQVKQMRKQLLGARVPEILSSIVHIAGVPFYFGEFEGIGMDDVRQLCQDVEKKTPGFYVLVNKEAQGGRVTILAYAAKGVETSIDLKKFLTLLREKFGIKGGGSASLVQGGSPYLPDGLRQEIEAWLAAR